METTVARIERLERNNRRMLVLFFALAALFALELRTAYSASAVLRANSLTIVDDNGRQRILMGGVRNGSVAALFDRNGTIRVGAVVQPSVVGVRLFDRGGKDIASLDSQSPITQLLFTTGGNALASLGSDGNTPFVIVMGPQGRMKLSLVEGWAPSLIATDAKEKDRVSFGQMKSGSFTGWIAGLSADSTDYSMP
jgi:hypothetical protein